MFSIAVEKGRLLIAPKFAVPTAPDAKEHVLYKEQFDQLLTSVNKKFVPLLTFLFYQGTRTAEALNLKWGQIDLETFVIDLSPLQVQRLRSAGALVEQKRQQWDEFLIDAGQQLIELLFVQNVFFRIRCSRHRELRCNQQPP